MASNPPKTDAERQALRRQRRKEETEAMRAALVQITLISQEADVREIAMRALIKNED